MRAIHIIFDGLPGADAGLGPRFVEVENPDGKSINAGTWSGPRRDGYYTLDIDLDTLAPRPPGAPCDGALLRTLEHCEETFRRYAKGHAEKGTREGDEKATANECLADMCAGAVATERARVKAVPVLIGHVKTHWNGREVGFVGLVRSPGPDWEPAYAFRPADQ